MFLKRLLYLSVYIPFGVIIPIYGLNTDYGGSVIIGFWISIVLLSTTVLPKVLPTLRWAFLLACIVLMPVTVAFE